MTTEQAMFSASVKYTDATGLEMSIEQPSAESGVEVKVSPPQRQNRGLQIGLALGVGAGFILGIATIVVCVNDGLFSWKASSSFGQYLAARFSQDSRPLAVVIVSLLLSSVAIVWAFCWQSVRLAKIKQEDRKINCDILKFVVDKKFNKELLLSAPHVSIHAQMADVSTTN